MITAMVKPAAIITTTITTISEYITIFYANVDALANNNLTSDND
jgi:hypothetical protein